MATPQNNPEQEKPASAPPEIKACVINEKFGPPMDIPTLKKVIGEENIANNKLFAEFERVNTKARKDFSDLSTAEARQSANDLSNGDREKFYREITTAIKANSEDFQKYIKSCTAPFDSGTIARFAAVREDLATIYLLLEKKVIKNYQEASHLVTLDNVNFKIKKNDVFVDMTPEERAQRIPFERNKRVAAMMKDPNQDPEVIKYINRSVEDLKVAYPPTKTPPK